MILQCIECGREHSVTELRYACECGGLLEVAHALATLKGQVSRELFDRRWCSRQFPYTSGVWRYAELVFPVRHDSIVSKLEGNTHLYWSERLCHWVGIDDLRLKHEGENPTGSFKDRGMTVGTTHAKASQARSVACASTGNTAASMAAYAACGGLKAVVFVPEGEIAYGKLSQSIAYGAKTIQIRGDFDAAMRLVREMALARGMYVLNSINPFRLEGQKSIVFELIQQLDWTPPDWIVLPGGNLGNTAAFGKALRELRELELISRLPRLAVIQAAGANPFYQAYRSGFAQLPLVKAETVASAIRIGQPVNYPRAWRAIEYTNGVVEEVSDNEIMDAKAQVDAAGIGCEPASAASVAGVKKLAQKGIIAKGHTVVVILTGHLLKDPDTTLRYHLGKIEGIFPTYANPPIAVGPTLEEVTSPL